ncbi:hypothetical protein FB451DRAFT_1433309 [Mycena latifolia]|nr:hypothetical protein FB451DRAFT_1433309 [Mycena latifolia]
MAEAMGPSNLTQVLDLNITGDYTPAYGLYENGKPVCVAVFNYVDDPTGGSNVTVVVSIAGRATPAQVKVKYLLANSVSQKGGYTWAGQTFGVFFESDGRLMRVEDIKTVQCDAGAQSCSGFCFDFHDGYSHHTSGTQVATVNPSVLATSNGHNASLDGASSTSSSGDKNPGRRVHVPVMLSVILAGSEWVQRCWCDQYKSGYSRH